MSESTKHSQNAEQKYVWLVYQCGPLHDDVISIWDNVELAQSALIYEEKRRGNLKFGIIKWEINIVRSQW